jgi:hypothetical protein
MTAIKLHVLLAALTACWLFAPSQAAATGYGDTQPRAMGMAGSYGALARGAEALYWNPANMGLKDSPKFSLPLSVGFSFILENNSWSVADYNDHNGNFIDEADKDGLLADLEKGGLKFNTDVGLFLPLVGGFTFPLPWGLSSAIAIDVQVGVEGQIPRDMIEFLLRGNDFEQTRIEQGRDPNYDIAEWDGESWVLGVFSWGFAKPWMPAQLSPYLSQFSVGTTLKVMSGVMGEVIRSDGGFITRRSGADIDAYVVSRSGGGLGFGLDFGVAGVTKNGKTVGSIALMNFLDTISWNTPINLDWIPRVPDVKTRQDSVFVSASDINALSFSRKNDLTGITDNPVDADSNKVFHEEIDISSFSRSLPAMMRIGVAHQLMPRLTVSGNYDQAFSSGFGISSTPHVATAVEYRLVDWFPVRFGLSVGGRSGQTSAMGFGFGPFTLGQVQLSLLETGLINRGGFLPGLSQGFGYSINLFKFQIKKV